METSLLCVFTTAPATGVSPLSSLPSPFASINTCPPIRPLVIRKGSGRSNCQLKVIVQLNVGGVASARSQPTFPPKSRSRLSSISALILALTSKSSSLFPRLIEAECNELSARKRRSTVVPPESSLPVPMSRFFVCVNLRNRSISSMDRPIPSLNVRVRYAVSVMLSIWSFSFPENE